MLRSPRNLGSRNVRIWPEADELLLIFVASKRSVAIGPGVIVSPAGASDYLDGSQGAQLPRRRNSRIAPSPDAPATTQLRTIIFIVQRHTEELLPIEIRIIHECLQALFRYLRSNKLQSIGPQHRILHGVQLLLKIAPIDHSTGRLRALTRSSNTYGTLLQCVRLMLAHLCRLARCTKRVG
jgi:hypothetical protein